MYDIVLSSKEAQKRLFGGPRQLRGSVVVQDDLLGPSEDEVLRHLDLATASFRAPRADAQAAEARNQNLKALETDRYELLSCAF